MTGDELTQLTVKLGTFKGDLAPVLHILRTLGGIEIGDDEEFDLDMDLVNDEALWELFKFFFYTKKDTPRGSVLGKRGGPQATEQQLYVESEKRLKKSQEDMKQRIIDMQGECEKSAASKQPLEMSNLQAWYAIATSGGDSEQEMLPEEDDPMWDSFQREQQRVRAEAAQREQAERAAAAEREAAAAVAAEEQAAAAAKTAEAERVAEAAAEAERAAERERVRRELDMVEQTVDLEEGRRAMAEAHKTGAI